MIHLGWGAVAVGTYLLGSSGAPDPGAAADQAERESSRTRSSLRDVEGVDDSSRMTGRRGATNDSASDLAALFGSLSLAGGGLDGLAEQAFKSPNPILRRLAFSQLLEAMTAENAAEIRSKLVEMGAGGSEWNDFHYSWGALAGEDAFAAAAASEERDLNATLSGWASANPGAALAMLDRLPESLAGQRDQLAEAVVSGLADSDRGLATELVLKLSGEGSRRAADMMRIVANETLRVEGPEAAARWSQTLPEGAMKGAAMDRVARDFARLDPRAAAEWAAPLAANDYAAGAVSRVGEQWGRQDPVAAVTWLREISDGRGQQAGLRAVFGDWEDSDPVKAGEYLMAMPTSEQRDSAISGFAGGYAWQDPQTAIAWASDISDPGLRQQSLTRAGQVYFRRDPEAARVWLESSDLPAEAQAEVLRGR